MDTQTEILIIRADIKWLRALSKCLERDHIIAKLEEVISKLKIRQNKELKL